MDKGKYVINLTYLVITATQAKAELKLWQQQGKNLLALVKLQQSEQGFSLCIPGYRCNNWYRLSNRHYTSRQAALAAYGKLLDSLSDGVNSEASQLKATA
uniref:hypothetical protein n=1 Tax=Rheinheimera sp. TaxID=1869214 RepID=UPI004048CB26